MRMEYTETLTVCHCWCGIALAIPANLYRNAHEDGRSVYCPLGHTFGWSETWKARYEREQANRKAAEQRAQASRELLRAEERSHQATRGHLTRAKRRSAAGTCPCCQRTFQQLARHMRSQHPDYVEEQRLT
jgi:hypothetical protein